MPNISGQYSLNEVATEVGISPAWIVKLRKLIPQIGTRVGTRGKAVFFDSKEKFAIHRCSILRKLNFSFDDINELLRLEQLDKNEVVSKKLIQMNKEIKQRTIKQIEEYSNFLNSLDLPLQEEE
jgi:DNA-binding transcriptional MerR regulator